MIDFELSEDHLAIQSMARKFADREIQPIAEKLDRSQNLFEDFPWQLVQKGSEIGFRTAALPIEYDGPEFDFRTWVVLIDELAYADVACAKIFSHNWTLCRAIVGRGTQEQKDRFLPAFRDDPTFLLAGDVSELPAASGKSGAGATITATRRGDRYVLNGKRRVISNGPHAKLLLIDAQTDSRVSPAEGTSTFLLPKETPGCSFACVHDRVGLRMYLQGELHLDNAEVPAENLLGGKEGRGYDESVRGAGNLEISAHAMALARVAIDAAAKYATERVQGGKQIIEHQAVALALADMYIALQAGRSLLWEVAWTMDRNRNDRALDTACKVFCTEAAVKICREAVELFGGSGVMRELPMQKYFRDSLVLLHMGGTNHANLERIGAILDSRADQMSLPQ